MVGRFRSARLVSLAVFLLATMLVWLAIALSLRVSRETSLQQASANGSNLARNIADSEKASIDAVDLLLKHFCREWREAPQSFGSRVVSLAEFLNYSAILQVAAVGADGRVAYSNLPGWTPVDLSDREHIKVHRERKSDELFISSPVLGRVSKQWTIQFTRPVLGAKQEFLGVIVISIPPPALRRYYKNFDLGQGGAIALARFDGQIFGHSQDMDKVVNVSLANTPGLGGVSGGG